MLVVIGALCAVARWLITAQEPSAPVLAVVQLAHGLTYGLTQVGIMGLLVRHVPGHVMARGQGYLAACGGIVASSASILSGAVYARLRAGRLLRDGGDGAIGRDRDVAGATPAGGSSPECGVRRIDQAAVVAQTALAVAREQQRSIEIDETGLRASSIAGAIASEVATMQPIMISNPSACAASAIASASVSPPVLSSLMLTAS